MNLAANLSSHEAEMAFLEQLRAEYEEKGYRFIVHPDRSELPDFFATYAPDAIARRPDNNVAIEVKSSATSAIQPSLQRIRRVIEGRPDWQFRVVYMGSDAFSSRRLPASSPTAVLERAREVELLMADGNLRVAFMLAWSLLEAALNSVRPDADKRPRTPGTVVQTLAMNGLISAEADKSLRSLVDLRNRVVHGDLTAEPSRADVQTVLDAVRAILT